jgi:hypothetical protein
MFNLTEYISGLFVNDPAMFMVQFILIPFAMMGFFTWLHYWKVDRNQRHWVNSHND